jgi:hypothetical protein
VRKPVPIPAQKAIGPGPGQIGQKQYRPPAKQVGPLPPKMQLGPRPMGQRPNHPSANSNQNQGQKGPPVRAQPPNFPPNTLPKSLDKQVGRNPVGIPKDAKPIVSPSPTKPTQMTNRMKPAAGPGKAQNINKILFFC